MGGGQSSMGGVHVSGLQNTSGLAQQLSSSMTMRTTSPCFVVGLINGGHFSGIQGALVTGLLVLWLACGAGVVVLAMRAGVAAWLQSQ